MYAFEDGVTVFNASNMNELLNPQSATLILEGTAFDSNGPSANNVWEEVHTYNFAFRITTTGVTSLSRIELEIDKDGSGQDLTLLIKDTDFNPDGSNEGTTLATILVPKEFLPAAGGWISIPVNLTGLTAGANYWGILSKVGDLSNHFHVISEGAADASHPSYHRSESSGAWTSHDSIEFYAYSGDTGLPMHKIEATNAVSTFEYDSGLLSKKYFYLRPASGSAGGIRKVTTMLYSGSFLIGRSVT